MIYLLWLGIPMMEVLIKCSSALIWESDNDLLNNLITVQVILCGVLYCRILNNYQMRFL